MKDVQRNVRYGMILFLSMFFCLALILESHTLKSTFFFTFCEILFLLLLVVFYFRLYPNIICRLQSAITNSFYLRKLSENKNLLVASLIISVVFFLICYPGFLYSDCYSRVGMAKQLKQMISNSIKGNPGHVPYWFAFVPCYFIAFFYYITGNVAAYTFFQAFFYFYFTFLLLKKMCLEGGRYNILAYFFFIVNPIFLYFSMFHAPCVGTIIGMVSLVLLLNVDISKMNSWDVFLTFIFIVLGNFVAFGYRANSFTIIPFLLFVVARKQKKVLIKIGVVIALFLGMFFAMLFPRLIGIVPGSSVSAGFVWKMGVNIALMPPEKQEKYVSYLDDLYGDGKTIRLCQILCDEHKNLLPAASFLFVPEGIDPVAVSNAGLKRTLKKYFLLYKMEPLSSIKTTVLFMRWAIGFPPHQIYGILENIDAASRELGLVENGVRQRLMKSCQAVIEKTYIPLHPWLMLLITSILFFLKMNIKKQNIFDSLEVELLLLAIFYYGAFCLNTQAMIFRYYYPAFYCMALVCISCFTTFIKFAFSQK